MRYMYLYVDPFDDSDLAFNSLFEMHGVKYTFAVWDGEKLSILYLRCQDDTHNADTAHIVILSILYLRCTTSLQTCF